uniref:Uncharacterized protein n=2 Tax=Rhodnius prolixus TaxID=13249 RepID=T1I959_RHOPR
MEAKEEFFSVLEEILHRKPEEATNILNVPKYLEILENSGWELVPRLTAYVTVNNHLENSHLYNSSVDLLLEIAKVANPEDVLFEFIEQAEMPNNAERFIVIMKAVQIVLMRLPQRRGVAIGWFCNALIRYITEVSIPQSAILESEEQVLLENDGHMQFLENLYLEILDFFAPFLEEVKNDQYSIAEKHVEIYRGTMQKTILKLFGHPLMNIHLGRENTSSPFRSVAENLIEFVITFGDDLISFLEFVNVSEVDNSTVDSEYDNSSLGVFYYLILVEEVYIEKIPCVYNSIYLLRQLLILAMALMLVDNSNAQWKGLMLAENALGRVDDKELKLEKAGHIQCREFAEQCAKIMIYFEKKRNRERAVLIFQKFLRIFDPRGRFYMLLFLIDTIEEPGFIGYLATMTKDFVAESLTSKNSEELKYFTGKCLRDLIKKFCRLEGGCETDLMRNSDLIISSLNLLRYLIIRDTENCTGFLELLPIIEINYLSPLKNAVQISRAHYEVQKKEINNPSNTQSMKTSTIVSVGGLELPDLSCEQKFQIIDKALNTFDLIDSLLSRLIECIHVYK